MHVFYFLIFFKDFFFFFLMQTMLFKSLYWICYNIVSVLCFGVLATRRMGA